MRSKQKGEIDSLYIILMAMVMAIVLIIILSVIEHKKHMQMLADNGCELYSEVETGKYTYCGKACFKPEIKRTYMCRNGWHEELR